MQVFRENQLLSFNFDVMFIPEPGPKTLNVDFEQSLFFFGMVKRAILISRAARNEDASPSL